MLVMESGQAHAGVHPEADAGYRAFVQAMLAGRAVEAKTISARLLAGGESAQAVYRVAARVWLSRATATRWRGGMSRLDALCAALLLSAYVPPTEAHSLLARAMGWAAGAMPLRNAEPRAGHVPPGAHLVAAGGWSAAEWAERVLWEAGRGDGASAEWALSQLLAGADRGSLPDIASRRAAYGALFAAGAHHARAGWGRLLITSHYAAEIAELLPTALTLLALRPAVWAVAGAANQRARLTHLTPWLSADENACALRLNRRAARADETVEWARALRAGSTVRVVEEALASGLSPNALLDAAILAALAPTGATPQDGLSGHAADVLLALHSARRMYALADYTTGPILVALGLLEQLPRLRVVRRARSSAGAGDPAADTAAAGISLEAVAREAIRRPTPHSVLVGSAIVREYAEARGRDPEYAAALLCGAATWLGLSGSPSAEPAHTHRAS